MIDETLSSPLRSREQYNACDVRPCSSGRVARKTSTKRKDGFVMMPLNSHDSQFYEDLCTFVYADCCLTT